MKILLFTSRIPFPAKSGYPIVVHNTIKSLLAGSAEVSIFSLNANGSEAETAADPLLEEVELITTKVSTEINIWNAFLSLFTSNTYQVSRFYQSASVAKLKNFLAHNSFDIIQLEGLVVLPYLDIIRQNSQATIVYRAHNIEHQFSEMLVSAERSFLKKLYLKLLAKRLYKFELINLNKPDAVLTINSSDQTHLKFLGCEVRMENFPAVVDPEDYKADLSKVEYPSIFHLGALDNQLNLESVDWFIRKVWDDLKALNVNLELHIAGKGIPKMFYDYQDDDIHLYNNIEDAIEFMNSKAIMIVPIQSGSGMRVKIIEGMAMKKCIISTSLGAQGINYEHGKNIIIADSADEFYKYILQCTTDRKMCESIGENARKLIEKEHNLNHQAPQLMSFYRTLTGD